MSDDRQEFKGRGRFWGNQKHDPQRKPGERTPNKESSQINILTSSLSPMAAEFVPQNNYNPVPVPDPFAEPYYPVSEVNGENEDLSVSHVRTIMYEIMVNPGKFDDFSKILVEALTSTIKDVHSLRAVVYAIFEQAVTDSTFSYNGARLCNYLRRTLTVEFGDQRFQNILLFRCKEEFQKKDTYVQDPNLCVRLCGFTMFIGELFIHFEIESSGRCSKVSLLGKIVINLLETLLTNPSKDNIKCVCQMLKFTGGDLEDFDIEEHKGEPIFMNRIFEVMNSLSGDGNVDRNSRILLNNLLELRSRNWDRLNTSSSVNEENTAVADHQVNEPVLYGPDGLPISTEEVNFLESNLCSSENGNPDDGCSDIDYYNSTQTTGLWSTNEDIDDEMAEEFEKFLLGTS